MTTEYAQLVPILNNATLSCAGLTEVIYYGRPVPFIHAAVSLEAFAEIYAIDTAGTATIRIFAEWSVDGLKWNAHTANLLSETTVGSKAGVITNNAATTRFGPLVRFNVGIVNSTASAAAARLTAVVNARFF